MTTISPITALTLIEVIDSLDETTEQSQSSQTSDNPLFTTSKPTKCSFRDYPHIVRRLKAHEEDIPLIADLHFLLYGDEGKEEERIENILNFTGYDSNKDLKHLLYNLYIDKEVWTAKLCCKMIRIFGIPRHGDRLKLTEKLIFYFASTMIVPDENRFSLLPITFFPDNEENKSKKSNSNNRKNKNCQSITNNFTVIPGWNRQHYGLNLARFELLSDPLSDNMKYSDFHQNVLAHQRILIRKNSTKELWETRCDAINHQVQQYCNRWNNNSLTTSTLLIQETASPVAADHFPDNHNETMDMSEADEVATACSSDNEEVVDNTSTNINWAAMTPDMLKQWQDDMLTFTINLDDDLVCHNTTSPTSVADTLQSCLYPVDAVNPGNESHDEYPIDGDETACSDNDNDIITDIVHHNTSNESIIIMQAITLCEHLIQSITQCKEAIHIKQIPIEQILQEEVEEKLVNVEKFCIEINDSYNNSDALCVAI